MQIKYEPHPVSPERKKELHAQGYRIIDAKFAPKSEQPVAVEASKRRKRKAVEDGQAHSEL